jgi:hypothetical protein
MTSNETFKERIIKTEIKDIFHMKIIKYIYTKLARDWIEWHQKGKTGSHKVLGVKYQEWNRAHPIRQTQSNFREITKHIYDKYNDNWIKTHQMKEI